MARGKTKENIFENGNKIDKKHYWLSPDSLIQCAADYLKIKKEQFFDPCPYPRPDGFDGLTVQWKEYNFVNPPFGVLIENGERRGFTAWARKCREEARKGCTIAMVCPVHGWLLDTMIFIGAEVVDVGNVKWLAIEDRKPGKGCGRIAMFIFRPKKSRF